MEGKLHHGWNNNLVESAMVRIIGNGREKNLNPQTNSPLLASLWISQAMDGGGRILFPLWTEGHLGQHQNSNLIEKCCSENTLGVGGQIQHTNSQLPGFSMRIVSGGW
jgi:hypothetical protein